MIRKLLAGIIFLSLTYSATATGGEYSISLIKDTLLKGANVVKRMEIFRFTIGDNNKAILYHKVAYTILNEKAERWSRHALWYDQLRSIESFEGTLFDAAGIKIKSLKKAELSDESGGSGGSFADDDRVKWHSFFYKAYPYTVEYETTVQYKGTMFLPDWIPQERPIMGVQSSQLYVIMPASNLLRFKMFHYTGEPVITTASEDRKQYFWEVKDMPPVKSEYASPAWDRSTTSVFLATESFVLGDYHGSNATWKDFGRFVYDLKKDRDELPAEIKSKVHELTDGLSSRQEKISVLYKFMQQHTRYVGVQLGIGGWQPFDAKYVSDKKYGDCKALSNYMSALLKEAGIPSVYTVITAGPDDDYLLTDLPSSQFNHAVLFVPGEGDTTWLECTSQTASPGYLGGAGNRLGLAVTENGGTLVRSPVYGLKENIESRRVAGTMDEYGDMLININAVYQAERQDRINYFINELNKDKLTEFLKEDMELATYDLRKFDYKEEKAKLPRVYETLEIFVSGYGTITGKRLFIVPNILSRSHEKMKDEGDRKSDIVLGDSYTQTDTTELNIPAGFTPETVPAEQDILTPFGHYQSKLVINGDKLVFTRRYEHFKGKFPASAYPALKKFYDAVYKADRTRLVMVKKTE